MAPRTLLSVSLLAVLVLAACDEPFLGSLPQIEPASEEQRCTAPEPAPSNLRGQVSGSAVHLTWDCAAPTVSKFAIDRSVNGGSFSEHLLVNDPAARSAVDSDVSLGSQYQYQVRALVSTCTSAASSPITVYPAPSAPTLTVVAASATDQLQLIWSDIGRYVDHLELWRQQGVEPEVAIDLALAPGSTGITDLGLAANTVYSYRLLAVSLAGDTGAQSSAPAVQARWTLPLAATGLTVARQAPAVFALTWSDPNQHSTYSEIWRERMDQPGFANYASSVTNHYVDAAVALNYGYRYLVVVRNPGGAATPTAPVAIYAAPQRPQGFAANAPSPTAVNLQWISGGAVVDHYELWRSATPAAEHLVDGVLAASTTNLHDSGLATDTQYVYRLLAWSRAGDATAIVSEAAIATVWTAYAPAVGFTATMVSSTEISLSWSDPNTTTLEARLGRKRSDESLFTAVATIPAGTTQYRDASLAPGFGFTYRLVLHGPRGDSSEVEDTSSTSGQPVLDWGSAPTLDGSCVLGIPAQASFDNPAVFTSASGSIEHVGGAVAATINGLSGVLTDLTRGPIATSWTVVDSLGGHSTLERTLLVEMSDAATMTALAAPTATLNHDTNPGRQVMLPSLEVDSGTGCHGCSGRRGAIAIGEDHGCVLDRDGTVHCWGYGSALGRDAPSAENPRPLPACVSFGTSCAPLRGVLAVYAGRTFSCALFDDSRVRCWGDNTAQQIGNGLTSSFELRPTPVCTSGTGPTCSGGAPLTSAVAVSLGNNFGCALLGDGTVRCWGDNTYGQLGDSTTTQHGVATPVCAAGSGPTCSGGAPLDRIAGIYAQAESTCALTDTGTVLCWGRDYAEQLGDGVSDTSDHWLPRAVCETGSHAGSNCAALDRVQSLSSRGGTVCAVRDDSTLWCWGGNATGELGNGDPAPWRPTPQPVCESGSGPTCSGGSMLTGVVAAAAGGDSTTGFRSGFVCALLRSGELRCWGDNSQRRLGIDSNGVSAAYPTPVRTAPTSLACDGTAAVIGDAVALALGFEHGCALAASGRVYCWGNDVNWRLGDGDRFQTHCAAVETCLSGTGSSCVQYDLGAVRACGTVTIDVVP